MTLGGRGYRAHRMAYAMSAHRALDVDLEIDHLCRVRNCVRPSHLEQVTGRENVLRSHGPAAINARKTHCHKGHEFTPENTYVWSNGSRTHRMCRTCRQ